MAAAVASFSQLQAVSVGRLKLSKALLVVDEKISTVLSRNSQLLSSILLNGPSRIVPLSEAARICGEGPKPGEERCVMIVGSAEDELVAEVRELLQGVFEKGDVAVYSAHNTTGTGSVPMFVCRLPLPQPTMLVMGSSVPAMSFTTDAQSRSEELKTLAFQASTLLESVSGGTYELFAIGARPRALAGAIKDWQQRARTVTSSASWGGGDDATHTRTHVLILDREADLIEPTGFPVTLHSRLVWLLGQGTASDPCFASSACKENVHVGRGQVDGSLLMQGGGLLKDLGLKTWEAGVTSLADMLHSEDASVKALAAARATIVEGGKGAKERALVEWCSAVEAALSVQEGAEASSRHDSALKVLQLAAEDALADEVAMQVVQLGELADASARKGGGLKLRNILEMSVHSFGRLGQKGVAELLAKEDESEGMMRLQAALASLVMRLESASGGGRGRKVGAEVEILMQRLVKIARRHGKGCGELAEGNLGAECPDSVQPLTRSVVHALVDQSRDFSVYHQGGDKGGSSGVSKAFQMGSSLLSGFGGGKSSSAGALLKGGCELLVVLYVGGVTLEETEEVKKIAEAGGVKSALVLATGVASHRNIVKDLCAGLPIISSHL